MEVFEPVTVGKDRCVGFALLSVVLHARGDMATSDPQAEKQSLRLQGERLEAELRLVLEQNTSLTGRLHKAERQVNLLTSQVSGHVTFNL